MDKTAKSDGLGGYQRQREQRSIAVGHGLLVGVLMFSAETEAPVTRVGRHQRDARDEHATRPQRRPRDASAMGGHWVVQEGFLLVKHEGGGAQDAVARALHRAALLERYFVLYMNRKMEMFESATKERRMDACYVRAFCGWDGEGMLKAGESYGLELKLEKNAHSRMFVAAFNRLDLEKWCRGFVAVLDPESAAGQEVRRERRKARKEEKRIQEEKEEKIRQWKEQRAKMIEDEKRRLQEREEEILNMTPLERIDDIGSLDDDTARILEKRKQRLQRRQAPTTRRVNKAAFRQRLEDAAGGKLENVQPLQTKIVEQKTKVRIEPPPPGQFIEASGTAATRRDSNPTRRRRLDSTDGSGSDNSTVSGQSRMSSGPFSGGSISGSVPPPPPPIPDFDDSRSDFIPPPPPLPGLSGRRESRSQSLRGSLYGEQDRHSEMSFVRASFSQSSRRLSGVDRDKQGFQDSLAAILGGGKMPVRGGDRRGRFDSMDSIADSTANGDFSASRKTKPSASNGESSMTNAFAASLAAIRRNRADTMDETESIGEPLQRKRDRKRDSQLSAEGKAIIQKAISLDEPKKAISNGGRKGLFDDSSSDDGDDSDSGLFGVRKHSGQRPSRERISDTKRNMQRESQSGRHSVSDESDDDGDTGNGFLTSRQSDVTSPRSTMSSVSASRAGAVNRSTKVEVVFKSFVLQSQGKKSVAVYSFTLRCGGAEHSFGRSYHEFEDIHQRMHAEGLLQLPKFPSKHLLRNFSKPENMEKRAMEFLQYFQQLVAIPDLFNSKRFLFEFQIPDEFVQETRGTSSTMTIPVRATPKSSRTPTPARSTASARSGATSRATALFGADDSDSDADSVASSVRKPRRTSAETEPKRDKIPKPSRKAFDEDNAERASIRRDRARSRNSVMSAASTKVDHAHAAEVETPSGPKVTGLPARPNLFGGGRGDLMAAIRQGAALKKVGGESSETSAASGTAGNGFPALASGPPPPPPPRPAPLTNAGSVAEAISNAMASRRIHVEYEDKSDDDSDDDWD